MSSWLRFALVFLLFASVRGQDGFSCIKAQDFDAQRSAVEVSFLTKKACARRCIVLDSVCSAFHYSVADGRCFILRPASSWSEHRLPAPIDICIKVNGQSPRCTAEQFPYAHGRSRYAFVRQKRTWSEAATHCENQGSKLVQITTTAEQKFVSDLMKKEKVPYSFNGLLQLPGSKEPADGFVWHRSGDAVIPSFWYKGEPNDYKGGQNIGGTTKDGSLDDSHSSNKLESVCECFTV